MKNSVLQHYGIRGMKWGVRRYQNKDGSLTPDGRKRYTDDELYKKGNNRDKKVIEKTPTSSKKKNVSEMSDDELNSAIRRLQLEKQYKDLSPKTVSLGEKFTKTVMNQIVAPAATEAGKQVLKDYLIKNSQKLLNNKEKSK